MSSFAACGASFLLAVLWFDLMFDVQLLTDEYKVSPESVIASISAYYRRVTTEARPMNRLVAAMMAATGGFVIAEIVLRSGPLWASLFSLVLVLVAVGVAVGRTVPCAVRLGRCSGCLQDQQALARSILRDHLFCLGLIVTVLVIQLAVAR